MLQNLHVKNLALIDEAEVDFSGGLNILTGETGAGKSIILGSVSLALGGRYSADMLRKGADKGLVELTFYVENPETVRKLEEMDLSPDGGQIIITRRFKPKCEPDQWRDCDTGAAKGSRPSSDRYSRTA